MKSFTSTTALAALVVAAASTLASADAQAVTQPRQFATNPTGVCQGALPAFETAIRKRPLAVQNEGTTSSFVTCSFTSQGSFGASAQNPTRVDVYLNAANGAAVTISCTGVSHFANSTSSQFITKSATAAASGTQTLISFAAADFTGAPAIFPSGLFSVSCNLPPGGAINDTYVFFSEDVGS